MKMQFISAVLAVSTPVLAGPYSGPTDVDHPLDPAIAADDDRFVAWANAIVPGLTQFAPRGSAGINVDGLNSLGDLDATELADGVMPGTLGVSFPVSVADGPGADFAVFENGFVFPGDPFLFAELAYVEVSSDGTSFARFPSVSTNTDWQGNFGQAFGGFDTTNITGLAGKHAAGFGTGFDLADLADDPLVTGGLVDLGDIGFVRLVDIPGDGSFTDSLGNPILDAWLSAAPTGGFDFQLGLGTGVGVINVVPEPSAVGLLTVAGGLLLRRRR
jgi:hypothetical protein